MARTAQRTRRNERERATRIERRQREYTKINSRTLSRNSACSFVECGVRCVTDWVCLSAWMCGRLMSTSRANCLLLCLSLSQGNSPNGFFCFLSSEYRRVQNTRMKPKENNSKTTVLSLLFYRSEAINMWERERCGATRRADSVRLSNIDKCAYVHTHTLRTNLSFGRKFDFDKRIDFDGYLTTMLIVCGTNTWHMTQLSNLWEVRRCQTRCVCALHHSSHRCDIGEPATELSRPRNPIVYSIDYYVHTFHIIRLRDGTRNICLSFNDDLFI